jgi:beta-mannosidase
VLCAEANSDRAVIGFRAVLDSAVAATVELRATIGDVAEHVEEQTLATGENRVEWRVGFDNPRLWWPHALGATELVDIDVEVRMFDLAEPSDRRHVTTGIRQVKLHDWIASVNGERLFLKGTNQGPTRMALGEATAEELERDVLLAKDAGLDLVRVHAHVSRPELYEAADRHGMLLWQDLPLQWGYARGTRKQGVRQAREAVDVLGHHPSIALWCAHNEPIALDVEPGAPIDVAATTRKLVAGFALPSWNKTVLDSSLRRALEKTDKTRPVIAHSGLPTGDSHLYFGWYHGHEAGSIRERVRRAGRAGSRRIHGTGPLARPRLGSPCAQPRAAEDVLRAKRARAGRLRKLRRMAGGNAGLSGEPHPAAHRDAAPAQVPARGRVRSVLPRRRPPGGDVVGSRPRAQRESGV